MPMIGLQTLAALGRFVMFCAKVGRRMVASLRYSTQLSSNLGTILARCIIPVCLTIAPISLVVALQGDTVLKLFGATRLLSSLLGKAMFQEVGPVITATLLAAQGGAACTAELGAMRVKEQIDATEVMGVDPITYQVAPRVIALAISAPVLTLIGCCLGLLASFIGAVVVLGHNAGSFVHTLWTYTGVHDVLIGMLKACVFGTAIGLISCYNGFTVTGGSQGVGKAVNETVVFSIVTFLVLNYFLSTSFLRFS